MPIIEATVLNIMILEHAVRRGLLAILFVLCTMQSGCDNTLEPYEEETGLFSVYGYLSLSDETQYVRIKDLNAPLTGEATRELDATVTLENLAEGTVETLQDTVVAFDDVYTHNYRVTMPIEPETDYHLTVRRSDGAEVSSTATTPAITEVGVQREARWCETPTEIVFSPLQDSRYLSLQIGVRWNSGEHWMNVPVLLKAGEEFSTSFTAREILEEMFMPRTELGDPVCCKDLDDERLFLRYTHFGPGWIHHLYGSNPLLSDDVQDGVGFFGALREDAFELPIDATRFRPGRQPIPPDECY